MPAEITRPLHRHTDCCSTLDKFLNVAKSAPTASNYWTSFGSPGPTWAHMTVREMTAETMATSHLTLSQRCTNGVGGAGFSGRFEQHRWQDCGNHRRTARLCVKVHANILKQRSIDLYLKKQTINTSLNSYTRTFLAGCFHVSSFCYKQIKKKFNKCISNYSNISNKQITT